MNAEVNLAPAGSAPQPREHESPRVAKFGNAQEVRASGKHDQADGNARSHLKASRRQVDPGATCAYLAQRPTRSSP